MKDINKKKLLRALPAVGEAINNPALVEAIARFSRQVVLQAIRMVVDSMRSEILADRQNVFDDAAFFAAVLERTKTIGNPRLRRLVNATGVVIHTNLGRSPLADSAIEAVELAARGYSNLEFNLESGKRGSRYSLVEELLCELTGAEAALVVNNNAGATLLALSTLAKGKQVIVSRGELIEIGGSFRVPDVMAASGAELVEVGTTNRTHLHDYERAIGDNTAMLMKVHSSNYRIVGFTKSVTGAELSEIAHRYGLVAMEDLGSGSLVQTTSLGLPTEPSVPETIQAGLDIVTFSGDKLLGGPQGGIIVGKAELVRACAKNPLHRALRVDKMTLAALEATLRLYRDPETVFEKVPTLKMITADAAELLRKAQRLARKLKKDIGDAAKVDVIQASGQVGGGALPMAELPGPVVSIEPSNRSINEIVTALRMLDIPIIVRIEQDRILADPRTILDVDESVFHNGMVRVLTGSN